MIERGIYQFGPFSLHVSRRLLTRDGLAVSLGSRAFDVLVALVEKAGEVVPAEVLIERVWPQTVVDPGSLRVHVSALRKVLGQAEEGAYVQNVPTRGYCFVAPVQRLAEDLPSLPSDLQTGADAATGPLAGAWDHPVDLMAPALVGREDLIAAAAGKLGPSRCLTLVGPPGIGKTSIAIALCGVAFRQQGLTSTLLDLAPLASADNLASRIAQSLGIGLDPVDPLASLARALQGAPRLLVLDNCEHLIDAVAALLELILPRVVTLRVVATSREPLRIRGESVMRIPALELPPEDWRGEGDWRRYAAVALFLQRADEGNDAYEIRPEDAELIGAICRRLDGVPLAIELAAASTPAFSLRYISERLDERLSLLVHGRRTALPRHRTLRAAIAWSYDLLTNCEQQALQCLSCFSGWFSLSDATAACQAMPAVDDADKTVFAALIHSLVSKSLLAVGGLGGEGYRLLESIREFARERLIESGSAEKLAHRHASLLLARLDLPEAVRERQTRDEWIAQFGFQLDDLRAALDWAIGDSGPAGDPVLAVALTASSVPVWFSMSLLGEFLHRAERVLALLDRASSGSQIPRLDMIRLQIGIGLARWHVHGGTESMQAAFARAGELAAEEGSLSYQLRSIWGRALACNANADYAGSRALAIQFSEMVAPHQLESLAVARSLMMEMGEHLVGHHESALAEARSVLEARHIPTFVGASTGTQFDPRVAALAMLARLHWILGEADTARAYGDEALERACALDHAVSLCFVVALGTGPLALWCGDFARAEADSQLMIDAATRRSLHFWLAFGQVYQGVAALSSRRTDWTPDAVGELWRRAAVSGMLEHKLCTFSPRFAPADLDRLLSAGPDSWCAPELLRVRALQTMARAGASAAEAALQDLEESVRIARRQRALAWELRSTTSLAELMARQGQHGEARDRLGAVLDRVVEGHDTADVRAALEQFNRLDQPDAA